MTKKTSILLASLFALSGTIPCVADDGQVAQKSWMQLPEFDNRPAKYRIHPNAGRTWDSTVYTQQAAYDGTKSEIQTLVNSVIELVNKPAIRDIIKENVKAQLLQASTQGNAVNLIASINAIKDDLISQMKSGQIPSSATIQNLQAALTAYQSALDAQALEIDTKTQPAAAPHKKSVFGF